MRSSDLPTGSDNTGAGQSPEGKRRRMAWRPFIAGVALVLLIVFAVQNTTDVTVHWAFFTTTNALITVIVVSAILGALVGQVVGMIRRRHKKEVRGNVARL